MFQIKAEFLFLIYVEQNCSISVLVSRKVIHMIDKIVCFIKSRMHTHTWRSKRTTKLFFNGLIRPGVTFYKQCHGCGLIVVNEKSGA